MGHLRWIGSGPGDGRHSHEPKRGGPCLRPQLALTHKLRGVGLRCEFLTPQNNRRKDK